MKKFVIAFLFLFISVMHLQAQVTSYIPNVIPPSPNAASLTKFSDVPVSPYTGTADIAVPIYTIQVKGLTIPISLDYHTGGIRLSEESGWVGLGWALNAGGMISRTINDKDDLGGLYLGQPIPQPAGDLGSYQPANYASTDPHCPECDKLNINKYNFDFSCSYIVRFNNGGADSLGDYSQQFAVKNSPYDMEPDNFSFNFLGKSGKFIVKRDRSITLEKQDNVRIQLIHPTNNPYFIITDDQGNKFYFSQSEQGGLASSPNLVMSWHLSQIVTQQNDVVTFNYTIPAGAPSNQVASTQTQTYNVSHCIPEGFNMQSNSGYLYTNLILQSIDYPGGQVQFTFDNAREDLQGGVKLNKIAIYSKTTAGLKFLREHDLYYTYFKPYAVSNAYEQERLRLDSVKEISGSASIRPYSFIYNAIPTFVEKHGFSVDHWGYYNGAGNTQLIPSMITSYVTGMVQNYLNYPGANRESSPTMMQCFSLQKITYPTGGYSTLDYSANTYDYNNSQVIRQPTENPFLTTSAIDTILNLNTTKFGGSTDINGNIHFGNIFPLIAVGQTGTNATLIITFLSTHSNGWTTAERNTFGKLYFKFNGSITDISSSNLTCGGPQCSVSIPLAISMANDSAYTWTAHFDPAYIPVADFSEIHIEVSFQGFTPVVNHNNPTLTGGGLRVSDIIDYNSDATVAKKRIWDYGYGSGQYSYGKLLATPSYAHSEQVWDGSDAVCLNFILFSNSNTSLTSTIGGVIVGYTHVTEYTVNPSNSTDNGKVFYSFVNTPDTTIYYGGLRLPGISNLGDNLNGSMLSKITYRNNSGSYWKLAETDNYYRTANRKVYYSAKYRNCQDMLNTNGYCPGGTPVANQGLGQFFPSIKSERVLLDSTRNIVYDPADTTKFQLTSVKNFYDDTAHYQVTRSKMVDSKGNTHVTRITYPQDYDLSANHTGNAILDSLIGRHMIAETIEKRDSLYYPSAAGNVTSATENRFKRLATGVMVQDKVYRLDITNPVNNFVPVSVSGNTYNQDSRYRQLISFDSYDSKNNIAQYTLANELPVSIIWDYRKMSPIAQVKNADTLSIAYTSFEAEGKGGWTVGSSVRDSVTAAVTGYKSYNLGLGNISKAGLTAGTTYVVSYWTKNAAPLTITGTITGYPLKGGTIKGWTYYEHKVTGITTVTLTGTGNIDEVRLYPQNAQMTSYTYSPQVGVTTVTDARDGISYYEYDGFQRLMNIKDQNGNILKSFDYHYANH